MRVRLLLGAEIFVQYGLTDERHLLEHLRITRQYIMYKDPRPKRLGTKHLIFLSAGTEVAIIDSRRQVPACYVSNTYLIVDLFTYI